jgi:hypothetical protein
LGRLETEHWRARGFALKWIVLGADIANREFD